MGRGEREKSSEEVEEGEEGEGEEEGGKGRGGDLGLRRNSLLDEEGGGEREKRGGEKIEEGEGTDWLGE